MQIVELEIKLSDEAKAIVSAAMATGRYVYEDEVIAEALYLLLQELTIRGEESAESRVVLKQPLDEMLIEFRQALDEKFGRLADVRE